jgi:hypothetical protein
MPSSLAIGDFSRATLWPPIDVAADLLVAGLGVAAVERPKPGVPGPRAGGVLVQVKELVSRRSRSACSSPADSPVVIWKLPKLSSVPAGMADGPIVMVGCLPDPVRQVPGPGSDATCEKPAGSGSEVQ